MTSWGEESMLEQPSRSSDDKLRRKQPPADSAHHSELLWQRRHLQRSLQPPDTSENEAEDDGGTPDSCMITGVRPVQNFTATPPVKKKARQSGSGSGSDAGGLAATGLSRRSIADDDVGDEASSRGTAPRKVSA